jgi:hypothetical protein
MVKEKKKGRKKSKAVVKKEVNEIFEVGNKEVVKKGKIEEKVSTKDQIRHQNKILLGFLILIGIISILILGFLIGPSIFNSNFKFAGLEWEIIDPNGDITYYHTAFYSTPTNIHNVYLRNDPRTLEKIIPFEGKILLKNLAFIKGAEEFDCEGLEMISQIEMDENLQAWGIELVHVDKGGCEASGEYTYIEFIPSNETKVIEIGESCYTIHVKDCEIFPAKERFLVEGLLELEGTLSL